MPNVKLAIVIPCYNEESILDSSFQAIKKEFIKLKQDILSKDSYIIFVDDGSTDNTWNIIDTICKEHTYCKGLRLSFNSGHQYALMSAFHEIDVDCAISIDADLQDDINCIKIMIKKHLEGSEIVYGVRKKRDNDSFFKKYSALFYYQLMAILGMNIIYNHADYRLLSRRAIHILKSFKEKHLSLRAIIPTLGLRSSQIYYDRLERTSGTSKYSFSKMVNLFFDSLVSSGSNFIFFIVSVSCLSILFFSLGILWVLYIKLATDQAILGWTSIVLSVFVVGMLQMLCHGLTMLYLGKIFIQSKNRPCYQIYEKSNF